MKFTLLLTTYCAGAILMGIALLGSENLENHKKDHARLRTITEAQLSGDTMKIKTQHDANNH